MTHRRSALRRLFATSHELISHKVFSLRSAGHDARVIWNGRHDLLLLRRR